MIWSKNRKIFCIGFNKTGTTSLERALADLGYKTGDQATAERMLDDWSRRDFRRLIRYCKTADAFQDIPFSLDYTYQAVDQAYPGSKFILTVRGSSNEWFDSLRRYHSKLFAQGETPGIEDLANAKYLYRGWIKTAMEAIFDYPNIPLYHREKYIEIYESHNRNVIEYFRYRLSDLLILNVAEQGAYQKLCSFLGREALHKDFPWLLSSK